MNIEIKELLFEAYRRNDMADSQEKAKPLEKRWLGLGTAAAYRPVLDKGLMVFHNGKVPPKMCMGWLCLTPAGVVAMESCSSEFSEALEKLKKTNYKRSYLSQYMLAGGLE